VSKGTPYQSCLEPFIDEIVGLRQSQRKRPVSCAKIAKYMNDKHKITVTRQAITDKIYKLHFPFRLSVFLLPII